MQLLLSMVESAAFCELACKARDADVRRFPADARLRSQPTEYGGLFADGEKRISVRVFVTRGSPLATGGLPVLLAYSRGCSLS